MGETPTFFLISPMGSAAVRSHQHYENPTEIIPPDILFINAVTVFIG
jgi:hypothetical protein